MHDLQRQIESLQATVDQKLYEEAEHENTLEHYQERINSLYEEKHKAEQARDAWRKQVRELTHGT